jgi:hypothetical protein
MSRTLFALGVAAYLASFFLVGVSGFDAPIRGYLCAALALSTPVGNILAKLGADDRTQAATEAIRRGIL